MKYIFIIIFLFGLVLPVLFLGLNLGETDNIENTSVREFPKYKGSVLTYTKSFEQYLNKNFGFRQDLFNLFSKLKISILNVSPLPSKVIKGKDGWLFLGNSFGDIVVETLGVKYFNQSDLYHIQKNLEERINWFAEEDIDFYLLIVPNKQSVYLDYLPYEISVNASRKCDQLDIILDSIGLNHVNIRDPFFKLKDSIRLYDKTNSHWNDLGAFIAYSEIIDKLRNDYSDLEQPFIEDYKIIEKVSYEEDISKMINLKIKENKYRVKTNEKAEKIETIAKGKRKKYLERFTNRNVGNKIKLVCFRDSFGSNLVHFLKESFAETVFVRSNNFDYELIKKEKPDLVMQILVERNIDIFKHNK